MQELSRQKVQAAHLARKAYLYIRQSTLQQVFQNTESTERQYALRRRAIALGWKEEDIVTIDCDLGQSGASAADREGFQTLVAEVSLGNAGIVLGLEVSRLARNSSDWHRLLEICALSDTLILDEDGLYDPANFNDRLLLGMKGTMSEAELHVLCARLQGGLRNKAARGELKMPLPVGLINDERGRVMLDPDGQVRETMATFFRMYRQLGSAHAVVAYFRENNLRFPRRLRAGHRRGELVWGPLAHNRARQVVRNPRYAGAFVFGRTRLRRKPGGRHYAQPLPRDEWHTVIPDAHPGYIGWEEYLENVETLRANARAWGADRSQRPPGEGPALLQGLAVCGVCGRRMTVRYHQRKGTLIPDYVCLRQHIEYGDPPCQRIPGSRIDLAIGDLLLEKMKPEALELALTVQKEVQSRLAETDRLRHRQVERAQYEADLARERFMSVDPRNRLVADQLEADWNERLRLMDDAREEYERGKEKDRLELNDKCREKIFALARDFPAAWNAGTTSDQQRKRMAKLLIEDVTLLKKAEHTRLQVRFRGGATTTLNVSNPLSAWKQRKTPPHLLAEINKLLERCSERQASSELNGRGIKTSMGARFKASIIRKICRTHGIKSRYERLREQGLLTQEELAADLGVSVPTIQQWNRHGLLQGFEYNGKGRGGQCLYEKPTRENRPRKMMGRKLSERAVLPAPASSCQGGAT